MALFEFDKISVLTPSAVSIEPEIKLIFAIPADFALNLMVKSLSEFLIKPGGRSTLSKFMLPVVLEKEGSCIQESTIELFLEIEETESKSVGKETRPETVFTDLPAPETNISSTISESTVYVLEGVKKERVAADEIFTKLKNKNNTTLDFKYLNDFIFI